MIVPLRRLTFREQIVGSLRSAILSGEIGPGSTLVESALAEKFGVSRGPLREAIRELVDEGLLITVAYTGTKVIDLSIADIGEIFTLRTALESFAFEQAWAKRDGRFVQELGRRHDALLGAIAEGDDERGIMAELVLHSLVYETAGHGLLLNIWKGLSGRLQLYWAAHHRAHGRRGPKPEGHVRYVELALGESLPAMLTEVRSHMAQGYEQTRQFLLKRQIETAVADAVVHDPSKISAKRDRRTDRKRGSL